MATKKYLRAIAQSHGRLLVLWASVLLSTLWVEASMAQQVGSGTTSGVSSAINSDVEQTWTVNFRETDIHELIRFVAKATGKTIIVDPKVKGKVQVVSAQPVNRRELYELFLSILEVHGYTAVTAGQVIRIIPLKNARSSPVPVVSSAGESWQINGEVITEVIQLENISAAKLIPVLRPLAPQQAHMAAYAPSNAIIISDTAANIARIRKVIQSIDLSAVQKTEVVPLEHASAEEVVRMLEQLKKSETAKGKAETKQLVLVADKRTNSILVTGDELDRQRVKSLISYLDTPLTQSGNVKVVYMKYAQAKELAVVLSNVIQNMARMSRQDKSKSVGSGSQTSSTIEADEGTNSLIITAEADVMQSLMGVIERLDIRRAQVLVEAIIVEITDNNGQDLGVEWLFLSDKGGYGSSTSSGLAGAVAAAAYDEDDAGIASAITSAAGQVLGLGSVEDSYSFNMVISALQQNTQANILSTPTLLTLDNEEASIVVGQSIPFVTGSYTSTGSSSNPDSPFQTVERENVGITLKITPQINEGDSLILSVSQEVSNVVGGSAVLNSNPITSERKIDTKVLVDNGQTIVLGGLIEDSISEEVQKVPLLGDLPVLGALFRSTSTSVTKTHLMIFLRTTIVRDRREMDVATGSKYRVIRQQQIDERGEGVDLEGDNYLPLLPEWQQQLEALKDLRTELPTQEVVAP